MSLLILIALILSAFLAVNIGANNSAASMGTSYGAGVWSKKHAVIIIAVFSLLGAVFAGAPVVETMGKGIVPADILSTNTGLVFIIILIAIIFISWANILRVPIATTHAIVCAIVGIGIFTQSLHTEKFFQIVIWWIAGPVALFILNFLIAKYFYFRIIHYLAVNFSEKRVNAILSVLLTISAVSLAFSGGANNSANAVGPIVGLGLINSFNGAVLAGVAMGGGAVLFGGRVLETVGKEITELCLIRAISVEITGAIVILAASIYGIPVSIAEIVTSGIVGFSCAQHGFSKTLSNRHVSRIAFFWFIIPFIAIGLSYILSLFYFKYDLAGIF